MLYRSYIRLRLFLKPDTRYSLAKRYVRGSGIEIGALSSPLCIPLAVHVKYIDRLSVKELRLQYPELKKYPLVNVDIIDNGETLEKIKSDSQDFVIASHLLEHCENPIKAIESFLRALKQGGILYMVVPDKRFTFDIDRPVTELEHLLKDYKEGPKWSHSGHFSEWRSLVAKKFQSDSERPIVSLTDDKYSIHFHVWTYFKLLELIVYLKQKLNFGFEVQEFTFAGNECIFIMKKT